MKELLQSIQKFKDAFAILIGIIGLGDTIYKFFNEKVASYIGISLILLASIIFFINRFFKRKLPSIQELENQNEGIIRGLLPFGRGDILLGRNDEKSKALTIINNLEFKFGFITGDAGVGKTSFIRAVLLDAINNVGKIPIYISRLKNDPIGSITNEIKAILNIDLENVSLIEALEQLGKQNKKIILIIDQFEEFFVSHKTIDQREELINKLGEVLGNNKFSIGIFVSLRKEFVEDLLDFSKVIEQPTDNRYCLRLKNWSESIGKQILQKIIKSGELSISAELGDVIISDLAKSGSIRPVEFQVVAKTLQEKEVKITSDYKLLGNSTGILASFLEEIILRTITKNKDLEIYISRLLLRMLCDDLNDTKKTTGLSLSEFVAAINDNLEQSKNKNLNREELTNLITVVIQKYISEFILVNEDELHINLVHDYLVKAIREATSGMETTEEKANQLFRRYIHERKLFSTNSLSWKHYRYILKYASGELLMQKEGKQILKQTRGKLRLYGLLIISSFLAVTNFIFPTGIRYNNTIVYDSIYGLNVIGATAEPKVYIFESDSTCFWNPDFIAPRIIRNKSNRLQLNDNWVVSIGDSSYLLFNIKNRNEFYEFGFNEYPQYDFKNNLFITCNNTGRVLLASLTDSNLKTIDTALIPVDYSYNNINLIGDSIKDIFILSAEKSNYFIFGLRYRHNGEHLIHQLLYKYNSRDNKLERINFNGSKYYFNSFVWEISNNDKKMFLYSDSVILLYDFSLNSINKINFELNPHESIEGLYLVGDEPIYILVKTNMFIYALFLKENNSVSQLRSSKFDEDQVYDEYSTFADTNFIILKSNLGWRFFKFNSKKSEMVYNLQTDATFNSIQKHLESKDHLSLDENFSPDRRYILIKKGSEGYLLFLIDSTGVRFHKLHYGDYTESKFLWSKDSKHLYVYDNYQVLFGDCEKVLNKVSLSSKIKGTIDYLATDNEGNSLYIISSEQIIKINKILYLFGFPIFHYKWPIISDKSSWISV